MSEISSGGGWQSLSIHVVSGPPYSMVALGSLEFSPGGRGLQQRLFQAQEMEAACPLRAGPGITLVIFYWSKQLWNLLKCKGR